MADKTIDQLDVGALALFDETTEYETQVTGAADPKSRKMTQPQMRFVTLDLAQLTAELAAADTDPASSYMLIQDPGLADGANTRNVRKMLVTEVQKLMATRSKSLVVQTPPKVGTTAGFVVAAANNLGKMATLPAASAASTLVVPISGILKLGETITAYYVNGSLQSGGNHNTFLCDLRSLTAAAAGAVDASLGVQVATLDVVANTIMSVANTGKAGLAHVVADGESFYLLITSTTNAACTQELQNVVIVVTGA